MSRAETFDTDAASDAGRINSVPVWDLPTRLFHWSLVAVVTTALLTGFLAPAWWLDIHVTAGYALIALLAFRLVWGVFGPERSRFASFAWGPRAVTGHLMDLIRRRPAAYLGHNPAGAAMIFALLAVLAAVAVTGVVTLGGQEKQGPLAGVLGYAAGHEAKEIHEALAFLLLALIAGHLAGVAVESVLTGDRLVAAMIHGRKERSAHRQPPLHLPPGAPEPTSRPAQPARAAVTLAALGGVAAVGLGWLGTLPPKGVPSLPANPTFEAECGDCHWAYHPSLLPAESWRRMMATLDDHFGEDASVKPEVAAGIETYLVTWASEAWDTEAANRLRRVSPEQPLRITETRFWRGRHHDIPPEIFKDKRVGGKGSCDACHTDADSGRFADQKIALPTK